jgi:hypothetical protein
LVHDPLSQLRVFTVALRNIAVPMDVVIVEKFAHTVFPSVSSGTPSYLHDVMANVSALVESFESTNAPIRYYELQNNCATIQEKSFIVRFSTIIVLVQSTF